MRGVLIKVVWSKQSGEEKLHKTEQNCIDFVDKLERKWCVVSCEEEWKEVTAARSGESEWRDINNK